MTALNGATQVDLFTVDVTADGALQESSSEEKGNWVVKTGDGSGASCAIVRATLISSTTVQLKLHPELTPKGSYTVTSSNVKDAGGSALTTESIGLVAGSSPLPNQALKKPFEGLLEGLFASIGEELDNLNGIPTTRLVDSVRFNAERCYVESTLGFSSDSASLFIEGIRVSYTSKTDGSFEGLVWPSENEEGYSPLQVMDENATVIQDVKSVP